MQSGAINMSKGQDERAQKAQEFEFGEFDLKSKDAKYKRWTPKMDQFLVKLLSDVVHSFPSVEAAAMTKKAWSYVCNQLRSANPETVYSTYTKYSCQQHLLNVIHTRYKIWQTLMLFGKKNPQLTGFSYKWNPEIGRFQVVENSSNLVVRDEIQVKALLFGEGLALPPLNEHNKGNLLVNDFFLSDNMKYMSDYHNEILPMLLKLDDKYMEGLEQIYQDIPRFSYQGYNNEFLKPLPTKKARASKSNKRAYSDNSSHEEMLNYHSLNAPSEQTSGINDVEESVDPVLKRRAIVHELAPLNSNTEFENVLASAAIAALNSPPVLQAPNEIPVYIKDRKWFNKLIVLHESGKVTLNEVLTVCEGVRDQRIPLAMLNILDPNYNKDGQPITTQEATDDDIVRRLRDYMIPMTFIQRS